MTGSAALSDAQAVQVAIEEAPEQKAADAHKHAEAFATLKQERQALLGRIELVEAQPADVLQQEKPAAELEAAVSRDRTLLDIAQAEVAAANETLRHAAASVTEAQKHHDDAHAAHERVNAAVTATDLDHQIGLYRADIACLEGALAKAEAAHADVQALTAQAANIEIDGAALKRLRTVAEKMVPLQARRDAALTRIEYRLTRAIDVDGKTIEGHGELLLESEKTLSLPGIGELVIKPGETNLSALIDELLALESEHARLLEELGVPGVAQAQARHEKWQALTAEKAGHARTLEHHAPDGIDGVARSARAAHTASRAGRAARESGRCRGRVADCRCKERVRRIRAHRSRR